MTTAVDSSVLMIIAKNEPGYLARINLLADALNEGSLVVCDVVVAELYALVRDDKRLHQFLAGLGINYVVTSWEAACFAGQIFRDYRIQGGPRQHLLPDFIVAAHAAVDCGRLATADRGYARKWFPKLPLLCV